MTDESPEMRRLLRSHTTVEAVRLLVESQDADFHLQVDDGSSYRAVGHYAATGDDLAPLTHVGLHILTVAERADIEPIHVAQKALALVAERRDQSTDELVPGAVPAYDPVAMQQVEERLEAWAEATDSLTSEDDDTE